MILLDRFVVDQRERLQDLLRLLDPSLRPLARTLADQLAELDAQATAVTGGAALPATALTADGDGVGRQPPGGRHQGGGEPTALPHRVGGVLDTVGGVTGGTVGGGTGDRRQHRQHGPAAGWSVVSSAA